MTRHHCPECGAILDAPTTGKSFACARCAWHLVTRKEWKKLSPLQQGFVFYMQASWPTSEIADEKNPHAEGSPAWRAFQQGEQRACMHAQDGEE